MRLPHASRILYRRLFKSGAGLNPAETTPKGTVPNSFLWVWWCPKPYGLVAQWVERCAVNAKVLGSNPIETAMKQDV